MKNPMKNSKRAAFQNFIFLMGLFFCRSRISCEEEGWAENVTWSWPSAFSILVGRGPYLNLTPMSAIKDRHSAAP